MSAKITLTAAQFDTAVVKTAAAIGSPATLYIRDGDELGVKLAATRSLAKSSASIGRAEWIWEPPYGPDEGVFNQFDYEAEGFVIVFERARDADTVRAALPLPAPTL